MKARARTSTRTEEPPDAGGLICVGLFVGWILLSAIFGKSGPGSATASRPAMVSQGLLVRGSLGTESLEGTLIRFIRVEIRGNLIGPHDHWGPRFVVGLRDQTDGAEKPILCFIPDMSIEDSGIFLMKSAQQTIPYRSATIGGWETVCRIPLDALVFPAGGERKVELLLGVELAERILSEATATMRVTVEGRGYEEMAENRRRMDQLTVELAMAVSAADGSFDEDEAQEVKTFVRSRIDAAPTDIAQAVKEELNEAVRQGARALQENRVPELCREMVGLTDPAQRYAVLELGLRIAGVDERADPGELRALELIARGLELDMDRFRSMLDKQLPIQFHDDKSAESVLGITPDMTREQVDQKLNAEFRKWNARATHKDPKIREQARQMIALISDTKEALRS